MADCKAIGELWGIEKPQLPREAGAREQRPHRSDERAAQGAPRPLDASKRVPTTAHRKNALGFGRCSPGPGRCGRERS